MTKKCYYSKVKVDNNLFLFETFPVQLNIYKVVTESQFLFITKHLTIRLYFRVAKENEFKNQLYNI